MDRREGESERSRRRAGGWVRGTGMAAGIFVGAWVALTAASVLLHAAAVSGRPGPAVQTAANTSQLLTAPGHIGMRVLTGGWGWRAGWGRAAGDAAAWAGWLFGAGVVLLARRRALGLSGPRVAYGAGVDLSRRRFLVDGSIGLAGVVPAGALCRSTAMDPWDLRVASYRVPIRDLPEALDGLTVVQISDTHLGPRVHRSFVQEAVSLALSRGPGLVLLTGDYIHNGTEHIGPGAEVFAPIVAAGVPVVGVLGNHDWYGDGPAMRAALERVGVRMIDNGRVFLDALARALTDGPRQGGALCLAGLGDLSEDRIDVARALGGVPEDVPRIVLAHNPDTAEIRRCVGSAARPAPRIDLMVSGHTHGGQVRLPLLGTPIVPSRHGSKYAGGLVRGPAFPVVVSRGVGMSLLPVRLGVRPEVVELTLVSA